MAKKIKKKTKIRWIPIFLFLLFIIVIIFLVSFLLKLPIKNIYISNNNILSDEEIIELANLTNYPSFVMTSSYELEKKITKSPYIKSVKVTKHFLAVVQITVEEYPLLFMKESDNQIVVDINTEIIADRALGNIPILVNYVPDTIYDKLIEEMKNVSENIKRKISQIEYNPNDYDKQRFLLYMNDGNYVYLTLTRFELINKYDEIYPTLDGKKGILYLDSGNHFEIKE